MTILRTSGAHVRYTRTGQGPAVLLIQGVGVIGEGWRPQIDGLADRFTLIEFDNRGIGGSTLDAGSERLTIEAMAADAQAIMDAERLDRVHVVGHSMGGVIAQELALAAPARVASLSLLCTFVRGRDGMGLTPGMMWRGLRTRVGTRAMRRQAFLELVMPRPFLDGVDRTELADRLAHLFGHDLADQPPIVMKQIGAMGRYDARMRLGRLASIPTLVVSATHDHIAQPASGRALAAAITGSRYVECRDAGHGITIQHAAKMNALLAAHFQAAATRS